MIEEGLVKQLFIQRALHCKRIRVDQKVVEANVNALFDFVKEINQMEECQDRILDTNLSNIKVMKELVPFILPDSVRLDPTDRKTTNLISIPENEEILVKDKTVNHFHDLQAEFRGFFRKDFSSEFETLDHLRVAKSFADVLPRMTISSDDNTYWVKYDQAAFVPIPLKADAVRGLFRDFYFTATYEEVIKEYFAPLVF